jgi:hypothetical protein
MSDKLFTSQDIFRQAYVSDSNLVDNRLQFLMLHNSNVT